jgi:bifunctional non-homologous end joining protein LigD
VKTTGGAGLHVVMPLAARRDWSECLQFARGVAEALARSDPRRYTVAYARKGRESRILIDYLRNNRTNTSVAAYSTRARAGAPVSVPVAWSELTPRLQPRSFTMVTLPVRLARLRRDPWAEYWSSRQGLTARMLAAIGRV